MTTQTVFWLLALLPIQVRANSELHNKMIMISGIVTEKRASLSPAIRLDEGTLITTKKRLLPPDKEWVLRILGNGGKLLKSIPVTFVKADKEHDFKVLNVVFEQIPSASRAELVRNSNSNKVEAALTGGGDSPKIKLISPTQGMTINNELEIKWEAVDPDNQQLNLEISVSYDKGKSWYHMGPTAYDKGTIRSPVKDLRLKAPMQEAEIRITASDGLLTDSVLSGKFTISQ